MQSHRADEFLSLFVGMPAANRAPGPEGLEKEHADQNPDISLGTRGPEQEQTEGCLPGLAAIPQCIRRTKNCQSGMALGIS